MMMGRCRGEMPLVSLTLVTLLLCPHGGGTASIRIDAVTDRALDEPIQSWLRQHNVLIERTFLFKEQHMLSNFMKYGETDPRGYVIYWRCDKVYLVQPLLANVRSVCLCYHDAQLRACLKDREVQAFKTLFQRQRWFQTFILKGDRQSSPAVEGLLLSGIKTNVIWINHHNMNLTAGINTLKQLMKVGMRYVTMLSGSATFVQQILNMTTAWMSTQTSWLVDQSHQVIQDKSWIGSSDGHQMAFVERINVINPLLPLTPVGDQTNVSDLVQVSVKTCMDICHSGIHWNPVASITTQGQLQSTNNIFNVNIKGFAGRTFSVATLEFVPFAYNNTINGTVHWSGLSFELLDYLALDLNFTYTVTRSYDGGYGSTDANGRWTGMIGMVYRKEVDLAATGLTITLNRQRAVSFSHPFYEEQSGVAIQRPGTEGNWFYFIDHFHWSVWVLVIVTLVASSFALVVAAKAACTMPKASQGDREFKRMSKALWFYFGSFLQQGSTYAATASPLLIVLGFSWLWVDLIYWTFSSNLMAFLTVTKTKLPFQTLREMVDQTEYIYGWQVQTSHDEFFKSSESGIYKEIWDKANAADWLIPTGKLNYVFTFTQKYAEVADFTLHSAEAAVNCDLIVLPIKFFPSSFGMAFQQDFPFLNLINERILAAHESGLLNMWLRKHMPKSMCPGVKAHAAMAQLPLENAFGSFIILAVGLGLSIIVLCIEARIAANNC